MTSRVIWQPQGLTNALKSAFRVSVGDAKRAAQSLNPAPSKIGVRAVPLGDQTAILKGTGKLAHIFEGGRKGGYPIQPGLKTTTKSTKRAQFGRVSAGKSENIAIKFTHGDQRFYRGPGFRGGAMKAKPFIHPAAALWARALYQTRARAAVASWGGRSISRFL